MLYQLSYLGAEVWNRIEAAPHHVLASRGELDKYALPVQR